MKKFLRITFVLLLGCMLLLGATACGGKNTSQQDEPNQERTIAPRTNAEDAENPDNPELPEIPETPHCPTCPRKHKISRLPHHKCLEDEDSHEKTPAPYADDEADGNQDGHCNHGHRPPRHRPTPLPMN